MRAPPAEGREHPAPSPSAIDAQAGAAAFLFPPAHQLLHALARDDLV
jgi:hypothetical protein